jgi:hypothetical protein
LIVVKCLSWRQTGHDLPAVAALDFEISVGGDNDRISQRFGHARGSNNAADGPLSTMKFFGTDDLRQFCFLGERNPGGLAGTFAFQHSSRTSPIDSPVLAIDASAGRGWRRRSRTASELEMRRVCDSCSISVTMESGNRMVNVFTPVS